MVLSRPLVTSAALGAALLAPSAAGAAAGVAGRGDHGPQVGVRSAHAEHRSAVRDLTAARGSLDRGMRNPSARADDRDMPSSNEHAFRYEISLCSLTEGETFLQPRIGDDLTKRRPNLRARLSIRRPSARRRAAR